mgnify:CR=1 FL=1
MKYVGIGLIGILGLVLLIGGGWAFRYYTAEMRGTIEAEEDIQSADYRVYSYDHFFNMYADIQAFDDQIKNQEELIETLTDEEEIQRYRKNINALKNQKAAVVREYNADARREETAGQFRDDGLPYQIELD